jgi:putative heme iron utilization protein
MADNSSPVQDAQKKVKPIAPAVQELVAQSKSVILGTVDADGNPLASYAPFARIGNKFYILVSFMARHTKNLRDQKKASVMFIEDESATKQIYARDRLTIEAATLQIERDTPEWNLAAEKLKEVHGKVLDLLTGMDDFIMIGLSPLKGSYVNGFGSAYFVDENLDVVEHRNDIAHTVREKK